MALELSEDRADGTHLTSHMLLDLCQAVAAKQALQASWLAEDLKERASQQQKPTNGAVCPLCTWAKYFSFDMQGIADTIGASTLMGRAAIPIKKYADNDGTEFDEWFDMGKGTFSNDNGCVSCTVFEPPESRATTVPCCT